MTQSPQALPVVRLYTRSHQGNMEAVLCFTQHIDPARAVAALQYVLAQTRQGGELELVLNFREGHVVLVDERGTHTPIRLLRKAKAVAQQMHYRPQVVAPPGH